MSALGPGEHPKRRHLLGHLQVVANRKRRATEARVVVPTSMRVEAGWNRRLPRWAFANSLRIADDVLAAGRADEAARIRNTLGLSVADCHLGSLVRSLVPADDVTVITSDPKDVRRAGGPVRIVTL